MCMLHLGLKEDQYSYCSDIDEQNTSPQVKMMDKALSMLIYDEYVPMPFCRSAYLCPSWSQITTNFKESFQVAVAPTPLANMFGPPANSESQNLNSEAADMETKPNFKMNEILSALAHTAMEDHMIDGMDFSGWDVSMSPLLEPLKAPSPPRQTLFLGNGHRKTMFLGNDQAKDGIKFVRSGVVEPKFPPAGVFLRSLSPTAESNKSAESGWSSLDDPADSIMKDEDWVIA